MGWLSLRSRRVSGPPIDASVEVRGKISPAAGSKVPASEVNLSQGGGEGMMLTDHPGAGRGVLGEEKTNRHLHRTLAPLAIAESPKRSEVGGQVCVRCSAGEDTNNAKGE
jgi:hypothetical protein